MDAVRQCRKHLRIPQLGIGIQKLRDVIAKFQVNIIEGLYILAEPVCIHVDTFVHRRKTFPASGDVVIQPVQRIDQHTGQRDGDQPQDPEKRRK